MWPCIQKSSKQEKANGKLIARENMAEQEEIVCPLGKVESSSQCRTDLGKSAAGRNRGSGGKGGKHLTAKSCQRKQ